MGKKLITKYYIKPSAVEKGLYYVVHRDTDIVEASVLSEEMARDLVSLYNGETPSYSSPGFRKTTGFEGIPPSFFLH